MSKTSIEIQSILSSTSLAATEMTAPLKKIGNGSMLNGLKKFYGYALQEGKIAGRIEGIVGTLVCAVIVIPISHITIKRAKKHFSDKKKHDETGEEIIEALTEEIADVPSAVPGITPSDIQ